MFWGCTSLQSVASLAEFFIRQKASDLTGTFYGCSSLSEVPPIRVSPNGASARNAFYRCISLKAPPKIDWENITDARDMFSECYALTDMDSSNMDGVKWYTSLQAQDVSKMFYECIGVHDNLLTAYTALAANASISAHSDTFYRCGVAWPNAELAQIPSSWGGTGA